jgi:hypothetical protein
MENNEVDIFGDDPEDLTTCWVCYNMFIDPITLKCSHTMCKVRLYKLPTIPKINLKNHKKYFIDVIGKKIIKIF